MIGCNYNGWTDLPEDEREGMEAFEASLAFPAAAMSPPPRRCPASKPQRKAA